MPAEPKDPVLSPETVVTPSVTAQPAPVATPEPTGGVPAAPPAASDKAPATPALPGPEPTEPETGIKPLGDGDALDRLTSPTEKPKENTPVPVETPAAKVEATPDAENKDAPPEPAEGEEVPFKHADEKELAGYHSRTRHRIKQYKARVEQLEGPAKFTYELADAAAQRDLKFESVVAWQRLGFGLRDRDPEAIQALANIVESHGLKLAGGEAAVDLTPVEAAVAEAFRGMDINESAKDKILAALAKAKPAREPAPAPQPRQIQQAPIQHQQPQPTEMDRTAAWVRNEEAQLAQRVGAAKWPELRKAIYAEAARVDATVPIHLLNDPIDMRIRFAACRERVLARASQKAVAPAVQVQPSLRATPSPTPLPVPKRGTPEYDDHILTHGIPPA